MPFTQQNIFGWSHSDFSASYNGGYLLFGFYGDLAEKHYVVVEQESYVFGPNGERYSIYLQPHPYDVQQGNHYPRIQLRIKNSNGRTVHSWGKGAWRLSLVAKDKDGNKETFEQDFKLWTFYYSPFIHGAPN
jgi:hypothetical protein